MIGRIRGKVIERTAQAVVVDVHGVGYLVQVTSGTLLPEDSMVDLHIHTHVREDAITLFGFVEPVERQLFHHLIGVPGIGPVKAMGILETPVSDFVQQVLKREVGRLSKLPGVGKKTAERIVVDLSDRLAGLGMVAAPPRRAAGTVQEDLESALVNLGFAPNKATDLAAAAISESDAGADLESLLKTALSLAR
ncbi:MAG: Holliday junction branch migration protein RuvA [Myxococcota bacterium]